LQNSDFLTEFSSAAGAILKSSGGIFFAKGSFFPFSKVFFPQKLLFLIFLQNGGLTKAKK